MMVNVSKKEYELREKLYGWRTYDPDTNTFGIRDDAPEDVKNAFEELKRISK